MKKFVLEYILKNKKNFIIIIIIFCIGISFGILFINNSDTSQQLELNNYVTTLIKNIKESNNINKIDLLLLSMKQNVLFIMLIYFLGCTIVGGIFIYIAILYKGFAIGYTMATLIAVLGIKTGSLISIASLLFQNVIFIPVFFIFTENGIKLYKGIYKRSINLKEELIKYTLIMMMSILGAIISSIVEVYVSTNLLFFLKEII